MSCCGGSKTQDTGVSERDVPDGAEQTVFEIGGMSCGSCVTAVKRALSNVEGVYRANVRIGSAEVAYDPSRVSEDDLTRAIRSAGYEVELSSENARSLSCC